MSTHGLLLSLLTATQMHEVFIFNFCVCLAGNHCPIYIPAGDDWQLEGHPVRLVGGASHYEGRVEILYKGVWGSVCSGDWDLLDSHVVCHQLGFGPALKHLTGESNQLKYGGEGRGPILLDDVQCTGNESSLAECTHNGWTVHNCIHDHDVIVQCSGMKLHISEHFNSIHNIFLPTNLAELNKPVFTIRLNGSDIPNSGIVEVYYGGHWGTICADHWDLTDAAVVCKQLGFRTALSTEAKIVYSSKETKLTWFESGNCTGHESQLGECQLSGWGRIFGCPAGHTAKATCARKGPTSSIEPSSISITK